MSDELEDLKRRVAELEAAARPKAPFVAQPQGRYDPTAGLSLPASAVKAMVDAVPDRLVADIVRDNRHNPLQPAKRLAKQETK